ncbi:heme-binding protein [Lentzea sp. NPDC060358]|uniref:GlcG/HbpS family heme-binding protein n=1 Tax=Lentzea sp. NPDC060358 TaxID=3347103 RepID=UPI0036472AE1
MNTTQVTTGSTVVTSQSISREAALALVQAAISASADEGVAMAVAVTGSSGHLKAFAAMDGSPFLATEVAVDKAWTAAAFGLPTHTWAEIVAQPATAQLAHRPRLVAVGGGFPIVSGGVVVGGLGLSGGTAEQDARAAVVALRALGFDGGEDR